MLRLISLLTSLRDYGNRKVLISFVSCATKDVKFYDTFYGMSTYLEFWNPHKRQFRGNFFFS